MDLDLTIKGENVLDENESSSKDKKKSRLASSPPIDISSSTITSQLLNSVKSIKKATRSLLSLKKSLNELGVSDDIKALLGEIVDLENMIKQSQIDLQLNKKDLEYRAYYDNLTGLPNRQFFESYVRELIEGGATHFYLVFIDLDDFKVINDTLGHYVGDLLLRSACERIKETLRKRDLVARYGGDELVAIINCQPGVNVESILSRLMVNCRRPYEILDHDLMVSISLGASQFPHNGETYEELLSAADEAMYAAKKSGKNQIVLGHRADDASHQPVTLD